MEEKEEKDEKESSIPNDTPGSPRIRPTLRLQQLLNQNQDFNVAMDVDKEKEKFPKSFRQQQDYPYSSNVIQFKYRPTNHQNLVSQFFGQDFNEFQDYKRKHPQEAETLQHKFSAAHPEEIEDAVIDYYYKIDPALGYLVRRDLQQYNRTVESVNRQAKALLYVKRMFHESVREVSHLLSPGIWGTIENIPRSIQSALTGYGKNVETRFSLLEDELIHFLAHHQQYADDFYASQDEIKIINKYFMGISHGNSKIVNHGNFYEQKSNTYDEIHRNAILRFSKMSTEQRRELVKYTAPQKRFPLTPLLLLGTGSLGYALGSWQNQETAKDAFLHSMVDLQKEMSPILTRQMDNVMAPDSSTSSLAHPGINATILSQESIFPNPLYDYFAERDTYSTVDYPYNQKHKTHGIASGELPPLDPGSWVEFPYGGQIVQDIPTLENKNLPYTVRPELNQTYEGIFTDPNMFGVQQVNDTDYYQETLDLLRNIYPNLPETLSLQSMDKFVEDSYLIYQKDKLTGEEQRRKTELSVYQSLTNAAVSAGFAAVPVATGLIGWGTAGAYWGNTIGSSLPSSLASSSRYVGSTLGVATGLLPTLYQYWNTPISKMEKRIHGIVNRGFSGLRTLNEAQSHFVEQLIQTGRVEEAFARNHRRTLWQQFPLLTNQIDKVVDTASYYASRLLYSQPSAKAIHEVQAMQEYWDHLQMDSPSEDLRLIRSIAFLLSDRQRESHPFHQLMNRIYSEENIDPDTLAQFMEILLKEGSGVLKRIFSVLGTPPNEYNVLLQRLHAQLLAMAQHGRSIAEFTYTVNQGQSRRVVSEQKALFYLNTFRPDAFNPVRQSLYSIVEKFSLELHKYSQNVKIRAGL